MATYNGYRGKRTQPYNIYLFYAALILLVAASAIFLFLPYARFLAKFFLGLGIISLISYLLGLVPSFATFGTASFYLQRIIIAGFLLWLLSFLIIQIIIAAHARGSEDSGNADYLIVLGAGLNGSTPSPTLQSRLDAAIDYAEANPETILVVTGGQGEGEDIAEAEAMRLYLTDRGIAAERILEERNAASTKENLQFSFSMIDRHAAENDRGQKVAVLTNEFHLYRTGIIAGKENRTVSLISAQTPMLYLKISYSVREYFALMKALFFYQ